MVRGILLGYDEAEDDKQHLRQTYIPTNPAKNEASPPCFHTIDQRESNPLMISFVNVKTVVLMSIRMNDVPT